MLKMVSKKSTLLLGAVLALCAFVLPSMASAASWSPVGTTGKIDSVNIGASVTLANIGWFCTSSEFHVTVHSASLATITAGRFANCHGDTGSSVGCTTTVTPSGFPWRATAITTTDIIIHGIDIDIHFETTPGTLNECSQNGTTIRLTGAVTASYTPAAHTLDFSPGGPGFIAHIPGVGSLPAALRGQATPTGLFEVRG